MMCGLNSAWVGISRRINGYFGERQNALTGMMGVVVSVELRKDVLAHHLVRACTGIRSV